jgi:hypothetical protein
MTHIPRWIGVRIGSRCPRAEVASPGLQEPGGCAEVVVDLCKFAEFFTRRATGTMVGTDSRFSPFSCRQKIADEL